MRHEASGLAIGFVPSVGNTFRVTNFRWLDIQYRISQFEGQYNIRVKNS